MSFDPFLSDYHPQNSRVVFGEIAGQKSLADVQDLVSSIQYRMAQMRTALGQINPLQVKDQTKFAALMVDAGNLQTRVTAALSSASEAVSRSAYTLLPASYTPAQQSYDRLMKAIKQGYPPDGAQVQRGDYDDVVNRIKQIGNVAVDLSRMPQPKAPDPDLSLLHHLPVMHLPDIPKPQELTWLEDIYRFVKTYEKEILIVGIVVGGYVVWKLLPHAVTAAKAAARVYIPGAGLAAA
jgi:hypothetical protein